MAFRDRDSGRIVTRVVYDGLAETGKTTNLRRLCDFFTTLRRSALHTPEEEEGRTCYFDFMRLDGGLIGGHPLSCHLVTVPGQTGLLRRRQFLLTEADAVVMVCDSTPEGLTLAARRLEATRRFFSKERQGVPLRLVVQANKQDLPEALGVEGVRERLALEPDVPVVLAQATDGVGVRETAVLGIRVAVDAVQALLSQVGLEHLPVGEMDATLLHKRMLEDEQRAALSGSVLELSGPTTVDTNGLPEWDELPSGGSLNIQVVSKPVVRAPTPVPRGVFSAASDTPPAEGREAVPSGLGWSARPAADDAADDEGVATNRPAPPGETQPSEMPTGAPDSLVRNRTSALEVALTRASEVPSACEPPATTADATVEPPWPEPAAASGHIWPGTTGRELLRKLDRAGAVRRDDLRSRCGNQDGSGRTDLVLYEVGELCLKTSARRRYDDADEARIGMAHLARAKISLGGLRPEPTVLAMAADERGAWLWTVAPWLQTLRGALDGAVEKNDEAAVGDGLCAFGEAAVEALQLTRARGLLLDIHPSNFAFQGGRIVYIDDDVEVGSRSLAAGHALLQRLLEYAAYPAAVERYVHSLERGLLERLGRDAAHAVGLAESLEGAIVNSVPARAAQARLLDALARPPAVAHGG